MDTGGQNVAEFESRTPVLKPQRNIGPWSAQEREISSSNPGSLGGRCTWLLKITQYEMMMGIPTELLEMNDIFE